MYARYHHMWHHFGSWHLFLYRRSEELDRPMNDRYGNTLLRVLIVPNGNIYG